MINKMSNWRGSFPAIVTCFNQDGSIDYKGFEKLLDFNLDSKVDGIVVCGTTGEAATMSADEYKEIVSFTVKHVNGRVPVIAGVGSNNTLAAVKNSKIVESVGVDAVLAVTPYYNKPNRNGIIDYFIQIADSVNLPVIMYNVPGRTGYNMPADLCVELSNMRDNIAGIKEASGDMEKMAEIISNTSDDFMVFSGDDALAFTAACLGANGVISVVANIIPREFSQMIHLVHSCDLNSAREIHFKYLKLIQLCFVESNPIPVKTILSQMFEYFNEVFRSPLAPISDDNKELLVEEIKRLNLS
ncbi:MAG: 4-hydroxy-tetrahydrodipicolinate synthase [Marinifilaceae bacterium]|jgi:4-hydroxy-tetrahydrodipicolinate synthase|nr:4-hydroxy-tetrahydrodipicolinate synthase [Marinifilaceae bacterium]